MEERGVEAPGAPAKRWRTAQFVLVVVVCAAASAGLVLLLLREPPESIELTIDSVPPDAEARIDGRVVGRTPATVRHALGEEAILVEVYADGYWPARRAFVPQAFDVVITVELEERPAGSNPNLHP